MLKYRSGAKHYRHPLIGDLTFGFKAFDIATDPGQSMTTVEAGSPSEEALNLLAGWTAAQLSIQTA